MEDSSSLSDLVARAAMDPANHRASLVVVVKSIAFNLAVALAPPGAGAALVADDVAERALHDLPRLRNLSAKELSTWLVKSARRCTLARLASTYHSVLVARIEQWLPRPLRGEAEDIWQYVCQVMDTNCERFEWWGERAFVALLQRIAERRVWERAEAWRDHSSRRVGGGNPPELGGADWPDPGAETPSSVLAGREVSEQLQRTCEEVLSRDEQQVIRLRFFERCTVRETAAVLGKSESAIKMITKRALARLNDRLGSSLGYST